MKKIDYLNVHNHTQILNLISAWIILGFTNKDIIEFTNQEGYSISDKEIDALTVCIDQQVERDLNHESME